MPASAARTDPHPQAGAAIPPAAAARLADAGAALIVDVREVDEYRRERIPGAALCPASVTGPQDVPVPASGQRLLLVCRSGRRAAHMAALLRGVGRPDATVIEGGMVAWEKAGLPVHRNAGASLPIMRQVMLTVGVLILGMAGLAAFVSPWWVAGIAAIGAGLFFAGATGVCALATVLGLMPWNRAPARACVSTNSCGGCGGG